MQKSQSGSRIKRVEGECFSAPTGEKVAIELDSNPTTGNIWNPIYDKQSLKLVRSMFSPSSVKIGGGGRQVFYFQVLREAPSEIVFIYQNPVSRRELARRAYRYLGRANGEKLRCKPRKAVL